MYIPWDWLKKHVIFPKIDKQQLMVEVLISLGLETEIVEKNWQFTPAPNRLDLFSWWGIAQEISILLNCPLNLPTANQSNSSQNREADWGRIKVNTNKCSQFQLTLIQKIEIHDSPAWIKDYLASNDIASVNNIIDIINLVMLETGQPLHAYDYDRLPGQEIVVRSSSNGETMTSLKGQMIALGDEDVVISAEKEIISLAGVVGSRTTSVNNQTTNVLIESGFFDLSCLKKTTQRLGFSTSASQCFSKGHNLLFGDYALARVIELIKEFAPRAVKKDVIAWKKEPNQEERTILISHEFIEKKLGVKLNSKKVEEILKKLRFSFQKRLLES